MGTTDGSGGERAPGARRTRRWGARLVAGAVLAGSVCAPLGWIVTDHLEQDNDFCNACHLGPGVPLHIDIRDDFDARPPRSLAALHAAAQHADPGAPRDGPFRCIACHGGASLAGRVRVKALAAKDSFWYLVGDFDEPHGMRWPLWNQDCTRCHARFEPAEAEPWRQPPFHALPVHNVALGVNCVECHLVHETGGAPEAYFLKPPLVRSQCARCHSEFEEG
jgi:hypothetical protein